MILLYLLGAALLIYLAASFLGAWFCLNMICLPECFDEAHERQREADNGFSDILALWDHEWQREPFSLVSQGETLVGEVIRNPFPAEGRCRVAVVCHGQTVNRISCLKYAKLFLDEGYHVLVFDERHFGKSGGSFCSLGQIEQLDIAAVVTYARSLFGEDCILGIHGESMGAASALLALQHIKADFVIADCPFAETAVMAKAQVWNVAHLPAFPLLPMAAWLGRVRFGYDLKKVNPIEAVAKTDTPICFMHGSADTLIACSHSERMFEVCRNPASEKHLFPDANHAESIVRHREEYEALMRRFIRSCSP